MRKKKRPSDLCSRCGSTGPFSKNEKYEGGLDSLCIECKRFAERECRQRKRAESICLRCSSLALPGKALCFDHAKRETSSAIKRLRYNEKAEEAERRAALAYKANEDQWRRERERREERECSRCHRAPCSCSPAD